MDYHEISAAQKTDYRKSGFLLAAVAAASHLFLFTHGNHRPYLAGLAVILGVLAWVEARPLRKMITMFIAFGNFMQRFTNPLIFGLIYSFAVIPTSFVIKLFGKDILQLRNDRSAHSYWKERTNVRTWKETLRKQY